jgi:hypothetical protein
MYGLVAAVLLLWLKCYACDQCRVTSFAGILGTYPAVRGYRAAVLELELPKAALAPLSRCTAEPPPLIKDAQAHPHSCVSELQLRDSQGHTAEGCSLPGFRISTGQPQND